MKELYISRYRSTSCCKQCVLHHYPAQSENAKSNRRRIIRVKTKASISRESFWSVYESNLQSYRSNMIASQSFLLAVAGLFFGRSNCLGLICAFIALVQLWYIWYRVIRVRTLIVDFYKYGLGQKYSCTGGFLGPGEKALDERTYCTNWAIRKIVNDSEFANYNGMKCFVRQNWRLTRIKLDIIMPVLFTVLWVAYVFFVIPRGFI